MVYTEVIWDFNGTILDDVTVGIEAINAVLKKYGRKTIDSSDEYRRLFGFPIIDYYERIGLERENYRIYADEWVREYSLRADSAAAYPNVSCLLEYFKENNVPQYLLSASERSILAEKISQLGLSKYFVEIVGQSDALAYGKLESAIIFAKKAKLKFPLVIGDSDHDADVAKAIGADCVLLAYGHQRRDILEKTGFSVFSDINDLLSSFKREKVSKDVQTGDNNSRQ